MRNFLLPVSVVFFSLLTGTTLAQINPNVESDRGGQHWKTYEGRIPHNAVAGGYEPGRGVIYICQASYQNTVQPGKVIDGRCNVTWGGQEIQRDDFRILVGHGYRWKRAKSHLPSSAVTGGYGVTGPLIICQAQYAGGTHPGKIFMDKCNIGYGGSEVAVDDFRILTKGERHYDNENSDNSDSDDNDNGDDSDDDEMGAQPAGLGSVPTKPN